MERDKKALLVLSGGQDSTTCGFLLKSFGYEIHALTIDYGQRHSRELASAQYIAHLLGAASHEILSLGNVLKGTSPLVSNATLDQYRDHGSLPGGVEKTFVPMRNQLFLTIAANRAYARQCGVIVTGVGQEDYGGYPDCREGFLRSFTETCNLGTFTGEPGVEPPIRIYAPLLNYTKKETVNVAMELSGCYEALAFSHTAYDGQYPPTGKDHATLLRAKGFEEAGIPDPLVLRARLNGMMDLPTTPNYSDQKFSEYSPRILTAIREHIAYSIQEC